MDWDLLTEYAVMFISQGYEEITATITFFFYELAKNSTMQALLHDELLYADLDNYNQIMELKYLDMCLLGNNCTITNYIL